MTTTPRLGITQLEQSQVQKEAVVNEAIAFLEMFATRLIVLSKGDNAPAGGEVDGDAYLVGSSGTGAFLGHDDELAMLVNGGWEFRTPLEGMEIEVLDEDTSYVLRGGSWVDLASGGAIEVLDEGVSETTALVSLDFVGDGISAADDGFGNVTVTVAGDSGPGVPSGTGFPGSPSTGDHFYRTDRNIQYYYDGTRWLSTQLFTLPIANQETLLPITATGQAYAGNPWWNEYDIYVLKGKVSITNTATTAANYFTFQFAKIDGTASNIGGTTTSQGDTQNQLTGHEITINAVSASTVDGFQLGYTETGAASAYILGSLQYRLVG